MNSPFAALNWGVLEDSAPRYIVTDFYCGYGDGELWYTETLSFQNFKVFSNLSDAFLYFWKGFLGSAILSELIEYSVDTVADGEILNWTTLLQLTDYWESWGCKAYGTPHPEWNLPVLPTGGENIMRDIWDSFSQISETNNQDVYAILHQKRQLTLSDSQRQALDEVDKLIKQTNNLQITPLFMVGLTYHDEWNTRGDSGQITLEVVPAESLMGDESS